jgi:hypothetical protein
VFILFFVAVSEGVFGDEFSVRFNFIAVDHPVITTEAIGNIRESCPAGKIVSGLLVLTVLAVWASLFPALRPARLFCDSALGDFP